MAGASAEARRFGRAPSLDEIAGIAERELARLPERFRRLVRGVSFRVEERCGEDVVRDMELEGPYDLLGLYHGVHIGEKDGGISGAGPDMVFLYRQALLDYWTESEDELEAVIRHVLVHEIGHHFGLSDDDMERIEAEAGEVLGKKAG